jgi:1,6-anhydro-N-acetylmuramate kinase
MPAATSTRRVNFNMAVTQFEDLQKTSATSGFTLTELLTTAVALLQQAYQAQAAGGQLILCTGDGRNKALLLPTKTVQLVDVPAASVPQGASTPTA